MFICNSFLPIAKDAVNLVTGNTGQGKTWLALNIAMQLSKEGYKILYWAKDENIHYIKYKMELLQAYYYKDFFTPLNTKQLYLCDRMEDFDYSDLDYFDAVILDPLISFFTHSNSQNTRQFITNLDNFAKNTKTTIVAVNNNHEDKPTSKSVAFTDCVRLVYEMSDLMQWYLSKDYDLHTQRKLELIKDGYGVSVKLYNRTKILTVKPKADFPELIVKQALQQPKRKKVNSM